MLTLTDLKEKLIHTAKAAGISDIGFTSAQPMPELAPVLKNADTYITDDVPTRINPKLIMNDAESIIVFICSYFAGDTSGNISLYARGQDYHHVMRELAQPIEALLQKNGYSSVFLCDSSPLPERYLAQKAGLGICGTNHSFIHSVYGSYVFIGCILTNCPLTPDTPASGTCIQCGKCIKACPSGALSDKGFSPEKCVSQLTQKKGELADSEKSVIKNSGYAWGCDICQKVCPHNSNIPLTKIPAFSKNLICNLPVVSDISSREFKRVYAKTSFSWRGKAVIERNLDIFNE